MKNLVKISLICLILLFSGCGVFRKVMLNKQSSNTKITSEQDTKIGVSSTITDRTITVETEKSIETKSTPEVKIKTTTAASLEDLANGLTIIDTGLVTIKQHYDTLLKVVTTSITLKPQKLDFTVDKTKTTYTDKKEDSKTSVSEQNKAGTVTENKSKVKKKEPAKVGIWLVAFIVGLIIVVGAIWLYFKPKKSIIDKTKSLV